MQDGNISYWNNGNIKILTSKDHISVKYYTKNGIIFCTTTNCKNENNTPIRKYDFDEEILKLKYIELLNPASQLLPYSDEEREHLHIIGVVKRWLNTLKQKDLELFNELTKNIERINNT